VESLAGTYYSRFKANRRVRRSRDEDRHPGVLRSSVAHMIGAHKSGAKEVEKKKRNLRAILKAKICKKKVSTSYAVLQLSGI
jgi:hypothetical protein